MKSPMKTFSKSAAALFLSILLAAPQPAFALLSSTDSSKLQQYEVAVFGKSRSNLSEESRIRALETNLFGKHKTGNINSRLAAIAKVLGNSSTSTFLPPMAAQFDPAEFGGNKSQPAPEFDSGSSSSALSTPTPTYSGSSAAAPESSDRAKDLLRQALQAYGAGKTTDAERMFKQVLSIDRNNADANFNLGAIHEEKGDLQGAGRYYEAAARINPQDGEIQDALSAVRNKIQSQQLAQRTKEETQRKAQLRNVANEAAAAYKAGNYDQAIAKLQRLANDEPNDPNVYFGLAQAYRGKGDTDQAIRNLNRAIAMAPNNELYRSTLDSLRQDAPRRQNDNSRDSVAQDNGYNSPYQPDYGQMADAQPPGQITPFDNSGDNGMLYGRAYDTRSMGGLGGLGSIGGLGLGALGIGGLSGLAASRVSGSSRLKRVVGGSLAGAALGAFTGRGVPGGVKSGAMRGAVYGGLMGLMMGF